MDKKIEALTDDPGSVSVVENGAYPEVRYPTPALTPPANDAGGVVVAAASPVETDGGLTPIADSFAWDKKAVEGASIMEKIDIATAEQNALASRQNIEKNAGMGQTQAMLGKYSANQAQERMGWTGGYALDSNMQMEFLKAQIQADMYGQLELQKMGYESQLSIARLNYELNMNQLAHQYYMDAQNLEIQRAQLVGEYISPENRELITQYQAAQAAVLANPADNRARAIVDQIEQWYQAEGLDREGIQGLTRIANLTRNEQQYEMNQAQLEQYQWERITATEEARREILDDYKIPVEVWSGGEPGKGVMTLVAIDPGTTNADDMAKVYDYFKTNPAYYEEVLDSLANQQIAWAEAADMTYEEWLTAHIKDGGVDKVAEFINKYGALDTEGLLPEYIDPMGASYRTGENVEDDEEDIKPGVQPDGTVVTPEPVIVNSNAERVEFITKYVRFPGGNPSETLNAYNSLVLDVNNPNTVSYASAYKLYIGENTTKNSDEFGVYRISDLNKIADKLYEDMPIFKELGFTGMRVGTTLNAKNIEVHLPEDIFLTNEQKAQLRALGFTFYTGLDFVGWKLGGGYESNEAHKFLLNNMIKQAQAKFPYYGTPPAAPTSSGSASHSGYSYGMPPQNPTVGQKWVDLEWNGTAWVKQPN